MRHVACDDDPCELLGVARENLLTPSKRDVLMAKSFYEGEAGEGIGKGGVDLLPELERERLLSATSHSPGHITTSRTNTNQPTGSPNERSNLESSMCSLRWRQCGRWTGRWKST